MAQVGSPAPVLGVGPGDGAKGRIPAASTGLSRAGEASGTAALGQGDGAERGETAPQATELGSTWDLCGQNTPWNRGKL